jgi:hypothetical protein
MLIGIVAGAISVAGFHILVPRLKRWGITDTCGSE